MIATICIGVAVFWVIGWVDARIHARYQAFKARQHRETGDTSMQDRFAPSDKD